MECPFGEVGCAYTNLSTNLAYQKHLSQNTEQHLQMVMNFHKTMLGSKTSNTVTEGGIVSPLQKLDAVASEVEFLDSVLNSFDMGRFPSLECIKTQLKMPDLSINSLGNTLAFRLPNFSQVLQARARWQSPTFFVKGGYKMCVRVLLAGVGVGLSTHLSVALVQLLDRQEEWPVALPAGIGIRVELLAEVEDEDGVEEDDNKDEIHEMIWKPTSDNSTLFKTPGSKSVLLHGRDKKPPTLPSWQKSNTDVVMQSDPHHRKSELSAEKEQKDTCEGVTVHVSELFVSVTKAQQYARQFNSLVFQVSLCLT